MDNEIYDILKSYRDVIDMLQERVDQLDSMMHDMAEQIDERCHSIESTLYEEILTPALNAVNERFAEKEYSDFSDKYKDKLLAYDEKLKAVEGPDFDVMRKAYDGWTSYTPQEGAAPLDEEGYVEEFVKLVESQLNAIRDTLGLSEDEELKITSDEKGDLEAEVNGEKVIDTAEDKIEEPAEEEKPEAEETVEKETAEDVLDDLDGEVSEDEYKRIEAEMKAEGLI